MYRRVCRLPPIQRSPTTIPCATGIEFTIGNWLNGSTDGSGWAGDDSGVGVGAVTLFIDLWLGSDGTALDNTSASDDLTGFPAIVLHSLLNSSDFVPPLPKNSSHNLSMCTTLTCV